MARILPSHHRHDTHVTPPRPPRTAHPAGRGHRRIVRRPRRGSLDTGPAPPARARRATLPRPGDQPATGCRRPHHASCASPGHRGAGSTAAGQARPAEGRNQRRALADAGPPSGSQTAPDSSHRHRWRTACAAGTCPPQPPSRTVDGCGKGAAGCGTHCGCRSPGAAPTALSAGIDGSHRGQQALPCGGTAAPDHGDGGGFIRAAGKWRGA